MTPSELTSRRLENQSISTSKPKTPLEVVRNLVALQAQDYLGALWSIALRTPHCTQEEVLAAITKRQIVRTWPMRGTLHFVAGEDIRWMLSLLAPRIIKGLAGRQRQLELTPDNFERSRSILTKELRGGRQLGRREAYVLLEKEGISCQGQRGIHILQLLCLEGLLCFGAHINKEPSFTLLEEWVPSTPSRDRSASLAELTLRYFTSHGPATLQDLMWWSGLTATDAKAGLEAVKSFLISEKIEEKEYWFAPNDTPENHSLYLLPGFDEYLLGYKDRSAALDIHHAPKVVPGNNGDRKSVV